MRIALAQINPIVGDVAGNARRVREAAHSAAAAGAQLVAFPEQTLLGYPAKDLLFRRELMQQNVEALHTLAAEARDIALLVGYAEPNTTSRGRPVFNSAALLHSGGVRGVWRKRLLPTYDVFDEARYFEPAAEPQQVIELGGLRIGVTICEDLLSETLFGRPLYDVDPARECAQAGADLILNLSASPFSLGKHAWRVERLSQAARTVARPVLFVNQVGGNDELLFDGGSCAISAEGACLAQANAFCEDLLLIDTDAPAAARRESVPSGMAELHAALVMGVRDYAAKCGFRQALLGLSGGVDSAVVARLAVAALGPACVTGVALPSRFSSPASLRDARELAQTLGIGFREIPIEPAHGAFERMLAPHFEGRAADVTEENLQARARGVLLMALSNKFGSLLLTTGNKSELAVGYCTLYGDMCGGLAVISDVPKTMVYELARFINATSTTPPIPENTLSRAPSAELRPDQTDQDTLPPYPVLDAILERFEERFETAEQIIAAGFERAVVERVVRLIRGSEYKRWQAAPGLKVTSRAYGFGRRMPIAMR